MKAIEIKNLTKKYGELTAVNDISFSVEEGGFFGFIGPNGAGKTTTIESIVGLLNYKGSIKVLGHDVKEDVTEAKRKVGLSPQEFNFDKFITAEESLLYTAGYYGIYGEKAKEITEKWLKRVGLYSKKDTKILHLSGGMKRRLIVARVLVHEPEIIILDEPTSGVDVELRRDIWKLMKELNQKGRTIILTSHYIEEVERLCSTIGIIHKGKIIEIGEKEKIMEDLGYQTLVLKVESVPEDIAKSNDLKIVKEEDQIKFIGKGIRKKAKGIMDDLEKRGAKIKEINIVDESLEEVFLRLTKGVEQGL